MRCYTRYEHYGLCDVKCVTKHFTDYSALNALQNILRTMRVKRVTKHYGLCGVKRITNIMGCAMLNALQNILRTMRVKRVTKHYGLCGVKLVTKHYVLWGYRSEPLLCFVASLCFLRLFRLISLLMYLKN